MARQVVVSMTLLAENSDETRDDLTCIGHWIRVAVEKLGWDIDFFQIESDEPNGDDTMGPVKIS